MLTRYSTFGRLITIAANEFGEAPLAGRLRVSKTTIQNWKAHTSAPVNSIAKEIIIIVLDMLREAADEGFEGLKESSDEI